MHKTILTFLTLFTMLGFSACKYDSAAPIRDIRFDPKLLGRLQADGPTACVNYNFIDKGTLKNLGTISPEYVLVSFDPALNNERRQKLMEQFGFVEGIVSQTSSKSAMLYTVRLMGGLNCQQAGQAIKELAKDPAIHYAGPYFSKFENGKEILIGISNGLPASDNRSKVELASPEFVVTPL